MTDKPIIHRASWLLPISHPPIQDGGLVVHSGQILTSGRYKQVAQRYPGAKVIDHPDQVLMPGLINAHTHLELSHLAHLSQQPSPPDFPDWIARMLAERAKFADHQSIITQAARTALIGQHKQGVIAIADISSTSLIENFQPDFKGNLLPVKEYLGLRASGLSNALHNLAAEEQRQCSGHAPYSTHIELLQALKKRSTDLGHIFPIHVAESSAEHEMISQGIGAMRDFLEQRGFWDGSFHPTGNKQQGSVSYLHQYGLLDRHTLCVHCIHVTEREIDLLAETKARICLCPGSNRYLNAGTAPVEKYLLKGILPALGTDSLTSNPELSIWREMRLLAQEHPTLHPENILQMATLGGAEALELDKHIGSLQAGKEAAFLTIKLADAIRSPASLAEYLVHQPSRDISLSSW